MQEKFEGVLPAEPKFLGATNNDDFNLMGLFFNPKRKKLPMFATNLAARLAEAGFPTVTLYEKDKDGPFFSRINSLLVLGGDGTVLRVAAYAANKGIPLIGVNCGTLGYLSEYESDTESIDRLISALKRNDFVCDDRTLISVTVRGETYTALNDIVVQRTSFRNDVHKVVKLKTYVGGMYLDTFVADGLIAATPTGSTAYFLSAGGNILAPDVKAIALAPVCAHTLTSRPVILSDNEEIEIVVGDGANPVVICDGKQVAHLKRGEKILIRKHEKHLRFMREPSWNFYSALQKKLNNGENR